jgi:hypothetical protein
MVSGLRPIIINCPICNDAYVGVHTLSSGYQVVCSGCGMAGPVCPNKKEAINHWTNISDAYLASPPLVNCKDCHYYVFDHKFGHLCEEPESLEFPVIDGLRRCPFFKLKMPLQL